MSGRFDGKVAVVTGGASGIGAATARRLVAEGAAVMIGDRRGEGAAQLADELGEKAAAMAVDVAQHEQVDALIGEAVSTFGRLDILVNNAGLGAGGKAPDMNIDIWHLAMAVNVGGVFYGCRAAIPHMRAVGGGAIINTASISGIGGDYGAGVYNASKGAVVNYTRSLALDHARENIRVNCVCPGLIETPFASLITDNEKLHAKFQDTIPMGRGGQADEIAATILFLASDDASYMTGAALVVDGGLTAHTGQPRFGDHMD